MADLDDDNIIRLPGPIAEDTPLPVRTGDAFRASPAARCLYCGEVGTTWFNPQHSCRRVKEVREGKRPAPKVKRLADGRTVIILDEETIAANPLGMKRYEPGDAAETSPPVTAASGDSGDESPPEGPKSGDMEDESPPQPGDAVTPGGDAVTPEDDRAAQLRARKARNQADRRARLAAQETSNG